MCDRVSVRGLIDKVGVIGLIDGFSARRKYIYDTYLYKYQTNAHLCISFNLC